MTATLKATVKARAEKASPIAPVPGLSKLVLPNGLTVFLLHRAGAPLVSARLVFPRGSASTPMGKSGLAELTAQLLRRGTRNHDAEEINNLLEGAGTDLGVMVSDDSTRFSLTAEPRTAEPLLRLLGELLREASFPKREVSAQRDRTCDQLKGGLDDAEWVASRAAYRTAFAGHPYGTPSEGWVAELAQLHRKDVRAFAEVYSARGAGLVLTGALDRAPIEAWLRPFRLLPVGPTTLPKLPAPAALRGREVVIVDKPDATQAQLRIVGSGFSKSAPDLVATVLGNGVLGDGFSSRLVNEIRVNRGLTYGVSSRFSTLAAGGLFMVRSFTRTEKARELVDVAIEQMQKLRDVEPAEDELRRVRTYLGGAYRLGTETAEQVGSQVADAFRYGLGDDWVTRYPAMLEETPREAVAAALRARLPIESLRVIAVGPAVPLEQQFKSFGAVKVVPLKSLA